MSDIDLHIDDYLELSYLKEKLDSDNVKVSSNTSYEEYEIDEKKYIFDPQEIGNYKLKYGGNSIIVNVYDTPNYPSGLIAHYEMEGSADDRLDNYNMSNNGVSFVSDAGVKSQAGNFDGGYFKFDSPIVRQYNNSGWTVSMLVKFEPDDTNGYYVYQESNFGSDYSRYANFSPNKYENRDSGGSYDNFNGNVSQDDYTGSGYNHLVGSWDGSTAYLYWNGKLNNSKSLGGQINNENETRIGNAWSGLIDDVTIYNRYFDQEAVSNLYEQYKL